MFVYVQTIDCSTFYRVQRWPIENGDYQRSNTSYVEKYPQCLLWPAQPVFIIFFSGIGCPFVFGVVFIFGRQSHDVGFRLETTRSVASRVIFDSRSAAIVGRNEHGQQKVSGYKGKDPITKENEPVVTIAKATVDQPWQKVEGGDEAVNEEQRKG